jgi:hypothetical protein
MVMRGDERWINRSHVCRDLDAHHSCRGQSNIRPGRSPEF